MGGAAHLHGLLAPGRACELVREVAHEGEAHRKQHLPALRGVEAELALLLAREQVAQAREQRQVVRARPHEDLLKRAVLALGLGHRDVERAAGATRAGGRAESSIPQDDERPTRAWEGRSHTTGWYERHTGMGWGAVGE